MLQETANENLKIGSDLIRRSDIAFMISEVDSDGNIDWTTVSSEIKSWEDQGHIKILADPSSCKHKDYCFQVLRPITAIPTPPDLVENEGSLKMTDIGNKKL